MTADAKSLEARFDQKSRNALASRFGIRLRENNEHAGDATVGHPSLRAVHAIAAIALRGARLNSRGVRAGLRLGQAKRAENFAAGHAAQIFFLLRVVAMAASTRATSSNISTYEIVSSPAPPHSSGVVMPQQPSSAIFLISSAGKRASRSPLKEVYTRC